MNAVDTNVYVYAFDADEAAKQSKALELFDRLAQDQTNTIRSSHRSGRDIMR